MENWIWGLVLDTMGLFSVFLLTKKIRWGWFIQFFNLTILWSLYAIHFRQWGFFPGITIHAILAFWGWIKWGRTEDLQDSSETNNAD